MDRGIVTASSELKHWDTDCHIVAYGMRKFIFTFNLRMNVFRSPSLLAPLRLWTQNKRFVCHIFVPQLRSFQIPIHDLRAAVLACRCSCTTFIAFPILYLSLK